MQMVHMTQKHVKNHRKTTTLIILQEDLEDSTLHLL